MRPYQDYHLGYIANNDVVMSVKPAIFCPHLAMSGFEPVPAQPYEQGSFMGIIKNS